MTSVDALEVHSDLENISLRSEAWMWPIPVCYGASSGAVSV
jgi:hypothetical protein